MILCDGGERMRFEQLECLVQIAETGSFTEAAKRLYLTQQAVSMSIKQLEQELNQTLIIRETSKVMLTQYGEDVVASARTILHEKETILANVVQAQEEIPPRILDIISTSCAANLALPRMIVQLQAKMHTLRFKLTNAETALQVLKQIKNGEKNIGLISFNERELEKLFAAYKDELHLDILARDEVIAVINRKDYNGSSEYFELATLPQDALLASYNIESADEWKQDVREHHAVSSNDADFIRALLDQTGVVVSMSGLSYQMFFSGKKYVGLPLKGVAAPIVHAAVYRKDAEPFYPDVVRMIRKEMHVK